MAGIPFYRFDTAAGILVDAGAVLFQVVTQVFHAIHSFLSGVSDVRCISTCMPPAPISPSSVW
jgi:hypothetical protein